MNPYATQTEIVEAARLTAEGFLRSVEESPARAIVGSVRPKLAALDKITMSPRKRNLRRLAILYRALEKVSMKIEIGGAEHGMLGVEAIMFILAIHRPRQPEGNPRTSATDAFRAELAAFDERKLLKELD